MDPLPSSPAQEALDLLFSCDSTEEAPSSPAPDPLSEAELALFDPYSKEGKEQLWELRREVRTSMAMRGL